MNFHALAVCSTRGLRLQGLAVRGLRNGRILADALQHLRQRGLVHGHHSILARARNSPAIAGSSSASQLSSLAA